MAPSFHNPRGVDSSRYFDINFGLYHPKRFFSIRTHQQTSLYPKLLKVVADVFGCEDAPLPVAQLSEYGMWEYVLCIDQT